MNNGAERRFNLQPLSPALGAVIEGVDLATDSDAATTQALRDALARHLVIAFRDQRLTPETLVAVGRRFGDLLVHPNLIADGPYPELITIRREPQDRSIVGAEWHTDTTCLRCPPMGAILYALDVPAVGGDTLFANQYLAFESLSKGMQRMLCALNAVHNDTRVAGPGTGLNDRRAVKVRADKDWKKTEHVHPVVCRHPQTNRASLYVNIAYTRRFEGMTEAESQPLLDFLFAHATRTEFTCRFRWQPGSVVFWDNRCLKHLAVNDCGGQRRVMQRVQIQGTQPVAAQLDRDVQVSSP